MILKQKPGLYKEIRFCSIGFYPDRTFVIV